MKTISSKNIIAKVFRDFGVRETHFVHDAVEWIGEVLERVGTTVLDENRACKYTVCDFKACIPPNAESITAVEYENRRLRLGADQTFMGYRLGTKEETKDIEFIQDELLAANYKPLEYVTTVKYPSTIHELHYYSLNPGYIVTSFESGEIIIYYRAFPTDDKGFPMIWDNVYLREACSWHIISRVILSGYQHNVIDFPFANNEAERFIQLAGNANFPSIERMERFRNMWVRMVPDVDAYEKFFEQAEKRGDIYR